MNLDRKLSPHFTLREMCVTSHRTVDNIPTSEIALRLATLCTEFLEPCRDVFGPLIVTSGYRSPELNSLIGGSPTSAHCYGCAADFVPMQGQSTIDIVAWVAYGSGLLFDQVIDEYSSTSNWIHLGMVKPGRSPRRQALTMHGGLYSPFAYPS